MVLINQEVVELLVDIENSNLSLLVDLLVKKIDQLLFDLKAAIILQQIFDGSGNPRECASLALKLPYLTGTPSALRGPNVNFELFSFSCSFFDKEDKEEDINNEVGKEVLFF